MRFRAKSDFAKLLLHLLNNITWVKWVWGWVREKYKTFLFLVFFCFWRGTNYFSFIHLTIEKWWLCYRLCMCHRGHTKLSRQMMTKSYKTKIYRAFLIQHIYIYIIRIIRIVYDYTHLTYTYKFIVWQFADRLYWHCACDSPINLEKKGGYSIENFSRLMKCTRLLATQFSIKIPSL